MTGIFQKSAAAIAALILAMAIWAPSISAPTAQAEALTAPVLV